MGPCRDRTHDPWICSQTRICSQTLYRLRSTTSQYNLHNETNLQTVPARSQQYYNSFLPSTTHIWNSLPDATKNSPWVESFKHKLNSNITKAPPYYFSGSRLGQIYHARIQLNCSLRYHLFQKNIIDNPVCECGEIENTSHFFLHCNLNGQLRHALLDRVSTYCLRIRPIVFNSEI